MRRSRARVGVLMALAALALASCGDDRQDADEVSGTFDVAVVEASFPEEQQLSQRETLRMRVRNTGRRAVPDLTVTVDGLTRRLERADVADRNRPVWIVDGKPSGGDTASGGTWALGRLAPGQTRTFELGLTPVAAGRWTVRYEVAAGLYGKAAARDENGRAPQGRFAVAVSREPPQLRVDPATGEVSSG